jgi:hypothetical protein
MDAVTVVHAITAHDDSSFEMRAKRSRQVVQHDAIAGLIWVGSPVPEPLAHAYTAAGTHLPTCRLLPAIRVPVIDTIAPAKRSLV